MKGEGLRVEGGGCASCRRGICRCIDSVELCLVPLSPGIGQSTRDENRYVFLVLILATRNPPSNPPFPSLPHFVLSLHPSYLSSLPPSLPPFLPSSLPPSLPPSLSLALVYNLGAHSLSLSLLHLTGGLYRTVKATHSSSVGGEMLDTAIASLLAEEFKR